MSIHSRRLFLLLAVAAACAALATACRAPLPAASPAIRAATTPATSIPTRPAPPLPTPSPASTRTAPLLPTQGQAEGKPAAPTLPAPPSAPPLPTPPSIRASYGLTATLDYAAHTLVVDEWITYTNTTGQALAELPLVVEARRYANAFTLQGVRDASGAPLRHRWKDDILHLLLPVELPPGQRLGLGLSYTLQLPDTTRLANIRPYPLGYTASQANLGDWYPCLPAYRPGSGWQIRPAATFGEHLFSDPSDYHVTLRFNRADLVVAAPALPRPPSTAPADSILPGQADFAALSYYHPAARNFAFSVSPFYEVITRTVSLPNGADVLLAGYHFPLHAAASQALVDTLARALPFYTQRFGAYPRPLLSAVQADFLDGMEYDGLFFLSSDFYNWHKDSPADFLVALAAHEAAHQWWGGLVGNDPAQQPWLDEALCTYSERLYYEAVDPTALEWWWAYRVSYYEPEGPVDRTIYEATSGQYQVYRNPVYLRGALFLEELRALVGDEAFFAALRDYAQKFAYRIASSDDFFNTLAAHSSADIEPLRQQYFRIK